MNVRCDKCGVSVRDCTVGGYEPRGTVTVVTSNCGECSAPGDFIEERFEDADGNELAQFDADGKPLPTIDAAEGTGDEG